MNSATARQPSESGASAAHNPFFGLAALMTLAFRGVDMAPLCQSLIERGTSATGADAANALMDLAIVSHLNGNHDGARTIQDQALHVQQVFVLPARENPAVRLLAICVPGELAANTPLEFLVENSDIELTLLYIGAGLPLPAEMPVHDVLFVAIAESEESLPLLKLLEPVFSDWPRPVLNLPERIARLSRDSASTLLCSISGVMMPASSRFRREALECVAHPESNSAGVPPSIIFPVIIRPVDSHAGRGLAKVDGPEAIAKYLETMAQPEFYVTPFVDYKSDDGLYRKYRVVLIDGRPYASHMAASDHWMVHYLNGGMTESAQKRAEEASFMATFENDFALRHRKALRGIAERSGLDYLVIDCAETRDGKLLVFEVDSSAVVHAMDSAEMFPYKRPQMEKVFCAFRQMLDRAMLLGNSMEEREPMLAAAQPALIPRAVAE